MELYTSCSYNESADGSPKRDLRYLLYIPVVRLGFHLPQSLIIKGIVHKLA